MSLISEVSNITSYKDVDDTPKAKSIFEAMVSYLRNRDRNGW